MMPRTFSLLLAAWALLPVVVPSYAGEQPKPLGVPVSYQLPADGPLPRTYRVTLAIVDPKNPDWIISQFTCGAARTVSTENQGKFTDRWEGLDDNFMPVPPGTYAVKGIYMPARRWQVDGDWHTITPKFVGGASAWLPSPEQWDKPEPFGGDPVGSPLAAIAVGPNGVAVWSYTYLENGLNYPVVDLHKPLGYEQVLRAFPSGGAAGGSSVATDGETVWVFSSDGGPKFVFRADGKSFGKSPGANRTNAYLPDGWVTAMAAWRDPTAGKSLVAVAQRGKVVAKRQHQFVESDTEFVDKITIHDGDNGKVLAEWPLLRPQGLAAREGMLYALHGEGHGFAVSAAKLAGAAPGASWQRVFTVPTDIAPADIALDSRIRFYLSDTAANKVFQLERTGKVVRTFGRLAAQKPGSYDAETFMAPAKLATWTDAGGNDRLLVVEKGGPNRASEWSAEGKLIREFLSLQTRANDGYTFDPEHPEHVYIGGQMGWLTRFRVDYDRGTWTVDAVWPDVGTDPRSPELDRPKLLRANGHTYLAGARSFNVYRLAGDRWLLSAAILRQRHEGKPMTYAFWHDSNSNGRVDDDEVTPTVLPGWLLRYHGESWLDDLSLVALNQSGRDVWRLAPSGFDTHGNPIFKSWQKLLTDPVFEARLAGKADAVHGGNELSDKFSSDWAQADGSMADGFYVQARGGKNFSANEGPQHKISRYVPDGAEGFRLKWRTGRTALQRLAEPGEMYGGMRIRRPINGLVSVVDQSRCGILLYTDDGLYVDTLFPDGRRFSPKVAGVYPQPGEFFAGTLFPNRVNGKIYLAMGKYTPMLFEAVGWSLKDNPVRVLPTVQQTVAITAGQIAAPPEIALSLRGGAGTAPLARFAPALGDPAFDGSLLGWEACEPVHLRADRDQSVEVRCLYRPEQLLLRWHVRLGTKFAARPLPPLERIFTHDQLADTVSFYIQGDVDARPAGPPEGRPGDVRFVFGIFEDGDKLQPVVLGLYPEWRGPGKAQPQVYRTPVGQAAFAHAGPIAGARLGHALDADGKGFVLVAAIPRTAIPHLRQPFGSAVRTLVNFEATLAGHNKFWWANRDGSASRETYDEPTEARVYPGSWAPAQFQGLEGGVVVRNWLICGPFGGPGAEKFTRDPRDVMPGTNKDWKQAARDFCEAATYPPDDGKVDLQAVFTGDAIRGYWPDPRTVRWQPATIADLDQRVVLGPSAQVWYGATWVHVPAATELELRFQGHPLTHLRWFLNGQRLPVLDYQGGKDSKHPVATKTLTLRSGWNQILFRGYCVGYPPFRAGLVFDGPAEKLWTLQLSARPPEPGR